MKVIDLKPVALPVTVIHVKKFYTHCILRIISIIALNRGEAFANIGHTVYRTLIAYRLGNQGMSEKQ